MRAKSVVIGVVIGVLLSTMVVLAGNLDPPSGPTDAGSQMYTLVDIYNRVNDGTAATKMTTFTEPATGPGTGTMRTLDEIMAIAPAEDNTDGALPAEVLRGKTYWGLRTDGTWGNQTGTRAPAPVPRTGQTVTHRDRDDGDLEKGVAWPVPRFTDNGNGTVTDNLTGLMWLQDTTCVGVATWTNSLTKISNLNSGQEFNCDNYTAGTFDDWRMPNRFELESLLDLGESNDALPAGHPFIGVVSWHWTSTTCAEDTTAAWQVDVSDGGTRRVSKGLGWRSWPVRGGQ